MIAAEHQPGTIHLIGAPGNTSAATRSNAALTSALLCARSIAEGTTPNAPVIVIGQDRAGEHAEACGLRVRATIAPPLGHTPMARRSLHRIAGGVDRIICWCDDTARLAAGMADNIELISTRPDRANASHRRFARIACFTERDQSVWRARGASPELRPLPDLIEATPDDRAETRARLGIEEPTIVLGALADTPGESNARGVAFLATVLQETGYGVSVVVPGSAGNIFRARRHHRARGDRFRLLVSDRSPIEWARAVDFMVVPDSNGSGSDEALTAMIEAAGAETVRLGGNGKATLAHAQHTDGSLLDRLEAAMERSRAIAARNQEPAHA